jgi:peptide/nickel transport system substrate-binding protein
MKKSQILINVLIIAVMLLSGCSKKASPTDTAVPPAPTATSPSIVAKEATPTTAPTIAPSKYNEAPELAAMVKAGTLPPVEERLPANPLVTTPVEQVGKYGGSMQTASWWPEVGNIQLFFAVEAPIKWKADLTGYEPALVESYEWSADGKTFTMHLRKGLKWSDGEPYTSADWKFWWEDLDNAPDQKLYNIPAYLRNQDGTPISMEFPDDYTVIWKSKDRPLWIDPYFMAQGYWEFAKTIMKPAHYLKQFHPKYTAGKTWDDMQKADQWWVTPGYPCLFAWCLTDLSSDSNNYTFTRNPYYWRVDTAGNQLPYINEIKVEIVADEQARILNCVAGKYDAAFRICGGPNEIPLLQEQASAKSFHFLKGWMNGAGAWPGYMVDQDYVEGGKNYEDDTPEHAAEIRTLLRDDSFRQALSIGFNRQRVIDVVWGGIGVAKNATVSPQSWHFASAEGQKVYNDWANNYIIQDLDKANAALDALGMKKGSDGWRTLPSGKPFTLVMDISDWGGSLKVQVDAATEMQNQWQTNLGIKVQINNLQGQPDLDTRTNEGYYMIRAAHVSEIDLWTYPDWLFPVVNRYVFPLEGRYYANGKDTCTPKSADTQYKDCGMKPEPGSPGETLQALYDKGKAEGDINKRHAIIWDAIETVEVAHGPFIIGVAGDQAMPIFIKDNLHNVLDFGVVGPWAPATPGNQVAAQWYFDPAK